MWANERSLEPANPSFEKTAKPSSGLAEIIAAAYSKPEALSSESGLLASHLGKNNLLEKEAESGPSALLKGVADGALSQPSKAFGQLFSASPEEVQFTNPANDSGSHRVGQIVGSLLPFVGAGLLSHRVNLALMGESRSFLNLVAEQASTGFVMGSVFTGSQLKPGDDLLSARLNQGLVGAATFATMAGTAGGLDRVLPKLGDGLLPQLSRRIAIGGFSGFAGGIADAEGRTGFKASNEDLLASGLGYAAFGTIMAGGGTLAKDMLHPDYSQAPSFSRQGLQGAELLAADTNATFISSPAGWYDKLSAAIYKAPKEHTIVVTDQKWFDSALQIQKSARRPDIKIVFEQPEAAANPGAGSSTLKAQSGQSELSAVDSKAANEVKGAKVDPYEQRRRLLENLRSEVANEGQDPLKALTDALAKSRVLMVGEYHVPNSAHRDFGASVMPELKKTGLTHLAIEHSSDSQGKVFKPDGSVDTAALPEQLQNVEFYNLLRAAKKEGIEVVPIDVPETASRDLAFRNRHMDQEIMNILENPANKVLYWVGNYHLRMIDPLGEGPQVAKLLRDRNIPLTTFYGQHDNFWREEPVRQFFMPDKLTAMPIKNTPTLASQPFLHDDMPGHLEHRLSQFDYVLMYPKQIAYHWD